MKDLKITTKDETIVFFIKDRGTSKQFIKKFATNVELFSDITLNENLCTSNHPGQDDVNVLQPSQEELTIRSPSRKRKKTSKTYICPICGIKFNENRDKTYKSEIFTTTKSLCSL